MANIPPAVGTVSVAQQILASADYYEPSIYSALTFCSNFELNGDPNGTDFFPLSPTAYKFGEPSKQGKMFVVGVLPPVSNISGRLLDRSASVAAVTGSSGTIAPEGQNGNNAAYMIQTSNETPHLNASPTTGAVSPPKTVIYDRTQNPPVINNQYITQQDVRQIYTAMHDGYVRKFGTEPTATQVQFMTAQSLRETGGGWPDNNPGFIGKFKGSSGSFIVVYSNGSQREFSSFDSLASGIDVYLNTINRNPDTLIAAQNGDVLRYLTDLKQSGYFEEPLDVYYRGFPMYLSQVAAQVPEAKLGNGNDLPSNPNQPSVQSGDSSTPNWQSTGSASAQQAAALAATTSGQDLNRTELGQAFQQAQQVMISDMQYALAQMNSMPPLRLLINPSSFKVSSEKICNDGSWTRSGPVIEHWGEGQDKISGSGKLAGFYAVDIMDATNPGLTRVARNWSMAYQNFLSLFLIYRNNGGLYTYDRSVDQYGAFNLTVVGSIYLFYDGILYLGSFDSFNLNESDTSPHTHDYDFEFTVRAWFALDEENPQGMNYGLTSYPGPQVQTPDYVGDANQLSGQTRRDTAAQQAQQQAAQQSTANRQAAGTSNILNAIPTTSDPALGNSPKGTGGSNEL